MSGRFAFSVCRTCGQTLFPPRALCPACGGASWRLEQVEEGVVEETTTVGGIDGASVRLATVRLDAGPVVVARLDGELGPGRCVELIAVNGALIARARGD